MKYDKAKHSLLIIAVSLMTGIVKLIKYYIRIRHADPVFGKTEDKVNTCHNRYEGNGRWYAAGKEKRTEGDVNVTT